MWGCFVSGWVGGAGGGARGFPEAAALPAILRAVLVELAEAGDRHALLCLNKLGWSSHQQYD
jgi:hypothetical protein